MPQSIKLTHLRSLKAKLIELGVKRAGIEVSTLACAFVHFERCILAGLVAKRNFKLIATACLSLATKLDDSNKSTIIPLLLDYFDMHPAALQSAEWSVFAALGFDLLARPPEYMPHVERILEHMDVDGGVREWLTDEAYATWRSSLRVAADEADVVAEAGEKFAEEALEEGD